MRKISLVLCLVILLGTFAFADDGQISDKMLEEFGNKIKDDKKTRFSLLRARFCTIAKILTLCEYLTTLLVASH